TFALYGVGSAGDGSLHLAGLFSRPGEPYGGESAKGLAAVVAALHVPHRPRALALRGNSEDQPSLLIVADLEAGSARWWQDVLEVVSCELHGVSLRGQLSGWGQAGGNSVARGAALFCLLPRNLSTPKALIL